jgi:hypothetical protein
MNIEGRLTAIRKNAHKVSLEVFTLTFALCVDNDVFHGETIDEAITSAEVWLVESLH